MSAILSRTEIKQQELDLLEIKRYEPQLRLQVLYPFKSNTGVVLEEGPKRKALAFLFNQCS